MQTIAIEILRLGTPGNHNLDPSNRYIALCGQLPAVEFSVNCDQRTFNTKLYALRYNGDEKERQDAICFLQQLIKEIVDKIFPAPETTTKGELLCVKLVITPKELAQLPFELVLTPTGFNRNNNIPFLLNDQYPVTLTREVRQVSNKRYPWPYRARILFASAAPSREVPYEQHKDILIEVLGRIAPPMKDSAEPVPDIGPLITLLQRASLGAIKEAIKKGLEEKNPYTHIHVLAHGVDYMDQATGDHIFKMALHDDADPGKPYAAEGHELAAAILAGASITAGAPAVVSLMACDSANNGNVTAPSNSIAHALHEAGIPCVFASQFPISVEGSVKLVYTLYEKLLWNSDDPRKALFDVRIAIEGGQYHDWASLIAQVRFPEDIYLQLEDTRLKSMFHAMKISNQWTDHLLKYKNDIPPEKAEKTKKHVIKRLQHAINELTTRIENGQSTLPTSELRSEHLGLLGSGYKRLAEHYFQEAPAGAAPSDNRLKKAAYELSKAKEYYQKGFDAQPSSHWNAVQYLSLDIVQDGISDAQSEIWTVVKFMAEKKEQLAADIDKAWAWGTLAEIYLIKPFVNHGNITGEAAALAAAQKYIALVIESKQADVIEATSRQLERYISWWPLMYADTFPVALKDMAVKLQQQFTAATG